MKRKRISKPFSFPVQNQDFVKSWKSGKHNYCVEVAQKPEGVAVRDSKNRSGATLFFTNAEWSAFLAGAKSGQFDTR
ncbi:MAG: hypothetical protein A3F53_00960 [Candidatus Zambryskibacteria bacterium RIFCSPHIGHO2_12_FULL_48_10]|uniref:DUF397 domain-containing protein n=1 Tax=Candidatus Zambryskibacteria bacterium RIFCSPHIGHO2_01_FULL_46_25 TaxID=1802738 RepID=A0A1G2SYM0_9BACT|nr:MAG: hypothetical protein UX71_C0002G0191 [Parcubacteria group bacterium GW2011_GWA1_47_10]OHA90093.1 MAG: hypothetical protein A2838_00475 [Candidatus Zambryskibacteria bacterium RIFCSPHIGHO2_01_FULL_46_25]OHB00855.1 MAG: hypothetical protein A3F53_00960 [Candidatus Zambryskibacteria bacterium RIFCSPHIGHO2_12_FULL_48_10]OHB06532.1 MAG: hypothetical protein A3A31_02780 [Candidatus Zambryskibacteria bacterium RIFCSPLOWO2_01_FULL_48_25]